MGGVVKFKYNEVVADHYRYMGKSEKHNDLRHDGGTKTQSGFEISCETTWWLIRVFSFFIAFTEVNAYQTIKYFLNTDDTFMN